MNSIFSRCTSPTPEIKMTTNYPSWADPRYPIGKYRSLTDISEAASFLQPSAPPPPGTSSTQSYGGIQVFNGFKCVIPVSNWISIYEHIVESDRNRAKNLVQYLRDDALNWFATEIAGKGLTWFEVKEKIIARFKISQVSEAGSAIERKLKSGESIQTYFQNKLELLRKMNLSEKHEIDLLTRGLPNVYQVQMSTVIIKNLDRWINIVMQLEERLGKQKEKSVPQVQFAMKPDFKPNYVKHNEPQQGPPKPGSPNPPSPCQYCLREGIKLFHWHSDCELRQRKYREMKNEFRNNRRQVQFADGNQQQQIKQELQSGQTTGPTQPISHYARIKNNENPIVRDPIYYNLPSAYQANANSQNLN